MFVRRVYRCVEKVLDSYHGNMGGFCPVSIPQPSLVLGLNAQLSDGINYPQRITARNPEDGVLSLLSEMDRFHFSVCRVCLLRCSWGACRGYSSYTLPGVLPCSECSVETVHM